MTDTFMTVAAVAAVANGTTIIRNIAVSRLYIVVTQVNAALSFTCSTMCQNQRVKECDRIEATVVGLKQCGVEARERPDGLEIDGNP